MNYLGHFVFNHRVCGLQPEPYFSMGVVLPDLWLRFSRKRRIRWKAVQAMKPQDAVGTHLRRGLLNHVDVDRRFHSLPSFLRWQRELKNTVKTTGVHPALVEFATHAGIELTLDHILLREDPVLSEALYDLVSQSDARVVADRVGQIGAVDTTGLDEVIQGFFARRFLRHYRTRRGLADVLQLILSLAKITPPPVRILDELFAIAVEIVHPPIIWAELQDHDTSPA